MGCLPPTKHILWNRFSRGKYLPKDRGPVKGGKFRFERDKFSPACHRDEAEPAWSKPVTRTVSLGQDRLSVARVCFGGAQRRPTAGPGAYCAISSGPTTTSLRRGAGGGIYGVCLKPIISAWWPRPARRHTPTRKREKPMLSIPTAFIPLSVPVPECLPAALGYTGPARFLAAYWEPAGDELTWDDGRAAVCGASWPAWLLYVQHRAVAPHVEQFNFGSSESEAQRWLIVDTQVPRKAYAAPPAEARPFLRAQWPENEPPAGAAIPRLDLATLADLFEAFGTEVSRQDIIASMQSGQAAHAQLSGALDQAWAEQQAARQN